VEADAELIGAKPAPGRDDVAADGKQGEAAGTEPAVPPRVKGGGVPEHDHQGTVLLRVPAPEAAPAVVSPETAEHRANKAEEEREADDTVGHPVELVLFLPGSDLLGRVRCRPPFRNALHNPEDAEYAS